jgi:hypothetical protein
VLAQLGLIDAAKLPVAGVESAEKVLESDVAVNMTNEEGYRFSERAKFASDCVPDQCVFVDQGKYLM